jgi:transposase-like protein
MRHTAYLNERRYRCNNCDTNYSVTVKTLFHGTHVDLRRWYLLIALVMESRKLPRVHTLADQIGVNKNTVTRMVKQIRSAVTEDFSLLTRITDEVTENA